MLAERRKYIRFDIPLDIIFRPVNNKAPYSFGVIRNFSRHGCCIESNSLDALLIENLEFKVKHPTKKDVYITATGDIVWKQRIDGGWLAGVRILDMDKEAKSEILDFAYEIWLEKNIKPGSA
jgi:c-di-GMP-binding flagellar brake protein YcgR